jgi:CheY-like chemotaxis protein
VRTEAGRGTTVSVLLPVTDQPESRGPVPPTALAVDLPEGLTVLVVDDDQLALESQCLLLEHHGVRVLAASSGLEAVAVFSDRAAEIDAVLLDQAMPGMDGVATFHRLQELRPGIPVVICSGFCEASIIDNIPAPGPAGFLRKPYGAAPLLAALADAVAQRRPPP